MTIVHHGRSLFWQFSTLAMTFQKISFKSWQLYTMAVIFFDKFPMNMLIWNKLTNLPLFLIFNLTIFTYCHALHWSGATNLWNFFSVKIISKYNLTNFQPGCEHFFLFDNFPSWLSTFFDNFTMRLSHKKSSKFWLTILLLFVLKLVDNFTFWQKYYNPSLSEKTLLLFAVSVIRLGFHYSFFSS